MLWKLECRKELEVLNQSPESHSTWGLSLCNLMFPIVEVCLNHVFFYLYLKANDAKGWIVREKLSEKVASELKPNRYRKGKRSGGFENSQWKDPKKKRNNCHLFEEVVCPEKSE